MIKTPAPRPRALIVPSLHTSPLASSSSSSSPLSDARSDIERPDGFDRPSSSQAPGRAAQLELQSGRPTSIEIPITPIFEYDRPEATNRFYEPGIHAQDRALLLDLWRDNLYFREEKNRLEAKCRGLEGVYKLETAENIQKFIDEKKRDNDSRERRRIQGLFGARDGKAPGPNFRTIPNIRALFEKMRRQCTLIAETNLYHYPEDLSAIMESTNATALLAAAFSSEMSGLPAAGILSWAQSRVSAEQLIFSLIGASIQEWVFKPTLRCITMLSTPLLERYREHIRALRTPP